MSKILLQTTIPAHPDDWDITRFSLLADELRAAGHYVIARNRANRGDDDPVLSQVDDLGYDQLWLRYGDFRVMAGNREIPVIVLEPISGCGR